MTIPSCSSQTVKRPKLLGYGGFGAFVGIVLLGQLSQLPAAEDSPITLRSPKEAIRLALQKNPEIEEKNWAIFTYQAKAKQAQRASYPTIQVLSYVMPIYRVEVASDNFSQYQKDFSNWGPSYNFQGFLMQPIYTFGKIDFAQKAAKWGIRAAKAEKQRQINQVAFEIHKLYWGYHLATQLLDIGREARKNIDKATNIAQKKYDKGSGEVTLQNLNRLKIFAIEIQKKLREAKGQKKLALHALKRQIGFADEDSVKLPAKDIFFDERHLKSLSFFTDLAQKNRPELRQAQAGIQAHKNLAKMHQAEMYPTIAIGAMVQARYSTMRPHINHPYIYDKYNHTEGNIGLGFVWRFQSFRAAAKRDEARAKAQKLRAKKRFARLGISLETHKVYVDLKQSLNDIKDTKKQLKLARRWAVSARSGYEAGSTNAEDLLKAMAAYLNYRIQFYRSHYRARVLQAKMGKTLGRHSAFLVGSPKNNQP